MSRSHAIGHQALSRLETLESRRLLAADLLVDANAEMAGSDPEHLVRLNDQVLFIADVNPHERALFATDGSAGGTEVIKHLPQASEGYRNNGVAAGFHYFTIDSALWRTDGTPGGTMLVKPGVNALVVYELNGKAVFNARAGDNEQLWVTDGTPAGTSQIGDIGIASGQAAVLGDKLYFAPRAAAAVEMVVGLSHS